MIENTEQIRNIRKLPYPNKKQIKSIYEKPTANMRINDKREKKFPLRSGKWYDICSCQFHSTLY